MELFRFAHRHLGRAYEVFDIAGRKQRRYSEELKREAVRLMLARGERSVAEIANELGVSRSRLDSWRRTYDGQAGQGMLACTVRGLPSAASCGMTLNLSGVADQVHHALVLKLLTVPKVTPSLAAL